LGGGETKVVTYSYTKEWCERRHDSNSFNDKTLDNTLVRSDVHLGTSTLTNRRVHYGEFMLPIGLVEKLNDFQDAHNVVGGSTNGFVWSLGFYYYLR